MRLLLAFTGAVCAFLTVATATGHADSLRLGLPGKPGRRTSRSVWLRQAGVNVSPAQFWGVSAAAALVAEMVCWSVGGSALVGFVPAVAGGLGPRAYFGRRRAVRLNAVVESWPQGVRDLLATMQSRRSVHLALLDLVETGPAPLRDAFAHYPDLAKLGGTEAALATIRDELADPVSDRMVELLIVAHEEGQSLTLRILGDQAKEVNEDLRTSAEIRASQQEPRLVAGAAAVMPWVGLVIICAGVAAYREVYSSPAGLVAVVIAGTMTSLGLFIARRLTHEDAEPRVLGAD